MSGRTQRKLAAILAADVVGYSRLMAADEAGTLAALRAHRESLFNPETEKRGEKCWEYFYTGPIRRRPYRDTSAVASVRSNWQEPR